MEDFRRLDARDQDMAAAYLRSHEVSCPELYFRLLNFGIERQADNRKSGWFYGYFEEEALKGVFFFANNQVFMCHYESTRILNKVVLLKAIKHYKPKLLLGAEEYIHPIWEMIRKTVVACKYTEAYFMTCDEVDSQATCDGLVETVDASQEDRMVAFLMEVEKAFGRPVTLIHNLKERLLQRVGEGNAVYRMEAGVVVGQSLIEFMTPGIAQIGGVYVTPSHRKKGCAESMVGCLTKRILTMGKTPVLVVACKNTAAVALYRKLGYHPMYKHITLEVAYG